MGGRCTGTGELEAVLLAVSCVSVLVCRVGLGARAARTRAHGRSAGLLPAEFAVARPTLDARARVGGARSPPAEQRSD